MSDVAALGSSRGGSKGSGDPDEIVQQLDGQGIRVGSPKRKPNTSNAVAPPMESNFNGNLAASSDPKLAQTKPLNGMDKREKDPKRISTAPVKRDDQKRQSSGGQLNGKGKDEDSGLGMFYTYYLMLRILCSSPSIFLLRHLKFA